MIVKKEPYQPMNAEFHQELIKEKTIANIKKQMLKMDIQPLDIAPALKGS